MKAPFSIIAVAVVVLFGSLVALAGITAEFVGSVENCRKAGQPLTALLNMRVGVLAAFPGIASLFGLAAAIGLFRLQEWARRIMLYLSTVPLTVYALVVFLPPAFILGQNNRQSLFVIGDLGYAVCVYFLAILFPLSLWWLILFTRSRVKSDSFWNSGWCVRIPQRK